MLFVKESYDGRDRFQNAPFPRSARGADPTSSWPRLIGQLGELTLHRTVWETVPTWLGGFFDLDRSVGCVQIDQGTLCFFHKGFDHGDTVLLLE